MGRTTRKDNRDLPHPKPVEKVQLSEKHVKLRIVLVAVFLVIGVTALAYGAISFLAGGDGGWQEITASNSGENHCGGEFVFQYDIGGSGLTVRTEYRQLTDLYTESMIHAYQLFSAMSPFEGVTNLYTINHHPGEVLTVEPVLYDAFRLLEENGRRELYLGPVYVQYNNLFYCQSDDQIREFDPFVSQEAAEDYQRLADYARDPDAVRLELLGENQIRLVLSEDYAKYAEEEGVTDFLDFYWMRNAFIIDYVAERLQEQGYTRGVLSSYDGFTRNLDQRGNTYAYNIFDRQGQVVYGAGTMQYDQPVSMVFLRDYPVNNLDTMHYYELENGEIRFPYVDVEDGLCRAALHNLVGYSYTEDCARILISLMPVYIADTFDLPSLQELSGKGIYSIYCIDGIIYPTESGVKIKDLYEGYRISVVK